MKIGLSILRFANSIASPAISIPIAFLFRSFDVTSVVPLPQNGSSTQSPSSVTSSTICFIKRIGFCVGKPTRSFAVVLAARASVEGFKRVLDSPGLLSIRIVEHYTDGLVYSSFDVLHPRMLFGDMIAIRWSVTPLNLYGVPVFNKAINLERLRAQSQRVRYSGRRRVWIPLSKAKLRRFFQK